MSGGRGRRLAVVLGAWGAGAGSAAAQPLGVEYVAWGLVQPVWVGAPRGDAARLFILEKSTPTNPPAGRVRVLDLRTRQLQSAPFLTVSPVSAGGFGEQGLLGMAFHPEYAANGYFWVYYTDAAGDTVVARYRAEGDPLTATAADPASRQVVLWFDRPGNGNHNGGWMDFGPDGHLYISSGDGGTGGALAASVDSLMGKILRIDVDGADNVPGTPDDDGFPGDAQRLYTIPADNPYAGAVPGLDEIWALGLRNPWRNDIDPQTGAVFIADVGESSWEEVSYQPAHAAGSLPGEPGHMGGRNYGWPSCEGLEGGGGCGGGGGFGFIPPVVVYGHAQAVPPTNATGCSITGGVVYRGCAMPELHGTYFFADLCSDRFFSFRYDGAAITDFAERTAELRPTAHANDPASFGRDGRGEVYFCTINTGSIVKVVPPGVYDINGDHVADLCRCPADWDGDAVVNSADISAFLAAWVEAVTGGTAGADYDRSGTTNSGDISAFLGSWLAALGGGC